MDDQDKVLPSVTGEIGDDDLSRLIDGSALSLVVRIHLEDGEMKQACPITVESRA